MPRAFLIKNKKEKKAEKRKAKTEPDESLPEKRLATGEEIQPRDDISESSLGVSRVEDETAVFGDKKAGSKDAKHTHTPAGEQRSQELLQLASWPRAGSLCTADSPMSDTRPESRGDISPTPSTPSPGPPRGPAPTPPRPASGSPGAPLYHPAHMVSPHGHQAEQRRREQLLWQSGYLRFPPSPPAHHLPLDHRYRLGAGLPAGLGGLGGGPGMVPTSLPMFSSLLPSGHMATPDPRRMFPQTSPSSIHIPRQPSFSPHRPGHQGRDLKQSAPRPPSHESYPRSVKEFETHGDTDADKNPSDVENQIPMELLTSSYEGGKKKPGPPRFQCDACKKSYSTFNGLSKHKEFHCTSHVKREFSCQHCDKTYTSLGALKMHIRTHTLPCKCKLCGKAFSRPWLLQGHVRTHTGEKPFSCPHCGRAFADRSNLRAHLQTHTDIKKYNCKTCTKTFSRMSLLLKHQEGSCLGLVR